MRWEGKLKKEHWLEETYIVRVGAKATGKRDEERGDRTKQKEKEKWKKSTLENEGEKQ